MGHLALLSLGFLTLPLDASNQCHSELRYELRVSCSFDCFGEGHPVQWWLQMASCLRECSDLLVSYVCVCVMPFFVSHARL